MPVLNYSTHHLNWHDSNSVPVRFKFRRRHVLRKDERQLAASARWRPSHSTADSACLYSDRPVCSRNFCKNQLCLQISGQYTKHNPHTDGAIALPHLKRGISWQSFLTPYLHSTLHHFDFPLSSLYVYQTSIILLFYLPLFSLLCKVTRLITVWEYNDFLLKNGSFKSNTAD